MRSSPLGAAPPRGFAREISDGELWSTTRTVLGGRDCSPVFIHSLECCFNSSDSDLKRLDLSVRCLHWLGSFFLSSLNTDRPPTCAENRLLCGAEESVGYRGS